jgi:hypothetical protein
MALKKNIPKRNSQSPLKVDVGAHTLFACKVGDKEIFLGKSFGRLCIGLAVIMVGAPTVQIHWPTIISWLSR